MKHGFALLLIQCRTCSKCKNYNIPAEVIEWRPNAVTFHSEINQRIALMIDLIRIDQLPSACLAAMNYGIHWCPNVVRVLCLASTWCLSLNTDYMFECSVQMAAVSIYTSQMSECGELLMLQRKEEGKFTLF